MRPPFFVGCVAGGSGVLVQEVETINRAAALRKVQHLFSERLVIFVGSGLSANYGLPTMKQLADVLISQMEKGATEATQLIARSDAWADVQAALKNGSGLEAALSSIEDVAVRSGLKTLVVDAIQGREADAINDFLAGRAGHGLNQLLMSATRVPRRVVIVTTNYDRLIEVAAERLGIEVNTSFPGKYCSGHNPMASTRPFRRNHPGPRRARHSQTDEVHHIELLKPHGCLSWYRLDDQVVSSGMHLNLERVLIAPTADKYLEGYEEIYSYHRDQANHALATADKLLVIGYGFGDVHLEDVLIRRIKSSISTVVVTRSIPDKLREILSDARSTLVIGKGSDADGTTLLASGPTVQEVECSGQFWNIDRLMLEALGNE